MSNQTNVSDAFDMLQEELVKELKQTNELIREESDQGNYDKVELLVQYAKQLSQLQSKVEGLFAEWQDIKRGKKKRGRPPKRVKAASGHLPKGLKTPEKEFYVPILESLVEFGGSASVKSVIKRVEEKMKGKLNDVDYQLLSSCNRVRWVNTAQWARNSMVEEGLLKRNSPYGVWEISEKGRKFVEENR